MEERELEGRRAVGRLGRGPWDMWGALSQAAKGGGREEGAESRRTQEVKLTGLVRAVRAGVMGVPLTERGTQEEKLGQGRVGEDFRFG